MKLGTRVLSRIHGYEYKILYARCKKGLVDEIPTAKNYTPSKWYSKRENIPKQRQKNATKLRRRTVNSNIDMGMA